jgi:hypothetical protein
MKTWNPDDSRWKTKWEELRPLAKHQAGKHDQKTHGRGSGGSYSASADAMVAFNDENIRNRDDWGSDFQSAIDNEEKLKTAYARYSGIGQENSAAEIQVENYATAGYQGINATARGSQKSDPYMDNKISVLDKTIEESPDIFGGTNLYRVTSDRSIEKLQPGDIFIDKGFMSTTRVNLTKNARLRNDLGDLKNTVDTATVILPSPSRTGKGLAVDALLKARGYDGSGEFWGKESEVLLPRNTALMFLGMSTTTDTEGKPIAIFQRMDK